MLNLQKAQDIKSVCISDAALKEIAETVILVSSKQLAMILGKRDDSTLRAQRSNGTGFNSYKCPQGNIYYNLIEVCNQLGIKI